MKKLSNEELVKEFAAATVKLAMGSSELLHRLNERDELEKELKDKGDALTKLNAEFQTQLAAAQKEVKG